MRLGQKVIIVGDQFEQNLPIGEHAYIIAYDRNADNAFDYVIRVPKAGKQFFVPASDVELEEVLLRKAAEKVEKEALIDFALASRNKELFHRVMNGESAAGDEKKAKEKQSQEEFIRQVNLKAWI
jgi:hypothetical protein